MKLKKIGQLSLAAIVSLVLLCGSTSCRQDFTTAYFFTVGTQYNQIGSYKESDETGVLTNAPGSPFGSGGTNPIRVVVLSGGRYLYVLNQGAAQTDASGNITYTGANISLFSVGGNGTLAFQASYTSQGSNSIRFLTDTTGKYLFVLDSYSPLHPPALLRKQLKARTIHVNTRMDFTIRLATLPSSALIQIRADFRLLQISSSRMQTAHN